MDVAQDREVPMGQRPIVVFMKDPGGTNAVLPIRDALQAAGYQVMTFASGNAMARAAEYKAIGSEDADEIFRMIQEIYPAAIITSMCSRGGPGRDAVERFRGQCTTIACQDFYGGGMKKDWADPRYRPDHLLVGDVGAASLSERLWPDMSANQGQPRRIHVTGWQAMDRLYGLDREAAETEIRAKLGMTDRSMPIVLCSGQLTGTSVVTREAVQAIQEAGRPVYLIHRPHPRLVVDAPDEAALCDRELQSFDMGTLIRNSHQYYPKPDRVVAGSSVVLSRSSTVLVEAAYLRTPAIAVLYRDTGLGQLIKSTNGALQEFPLSTIGATSTASNHDALVGLLREAYVGELGVRQLVSQTRFCVNDGQSTRRAVEAICQILS